MLRDFGFALALSALAGLVGCAGTPNDDARNGGSQAASNVSVEDKVDIDAMRAAARAAQASGDIKRALKYWRRVVSTDPTPAHARAYARVLRESGDSEQAYVVLKDNEASDPSAGYLAEKGRAALSGGYTDRAVQALERSLKKDPDPVVRSMLAIAHVRKGRTEEGLDLARQAVESADADVYAPRVNLAMLEAQTGDLAEANRILEDAASRPGAPERVKAMEETIVRIREARKDSQPGASAFEKWLETPDRTSSSEPEADAQGDVWYVRVNASRVTDDVIDRMREASMPTAGSGEPLRFRMTQTPAGRSRVILAPMKTFADARGLCETVRKTGAACQAIPDGQLGDG